MRSAIKQACVLPLAALVGCSMNGETGLGAANDVAMNASTVRSVSDEPVIIGPPFTVGAIIYTPQDAAAYDEVGYAGYYRLGAAQSITGNGEAFNAAAVTAAHKTLPLPSYVEVTALDTGRTILVRVNDRGPFANDRIIDLSPGAARQLGVDGQANVGVRVRRVNPPEQERAVLRQGLTAAERMETPVQLLKVLRDKLAKLPNPAGSVRAAGAAAPVEAISDADGRFVREVAGTGLSVKTSTTEPPRYWAVQIAAFSSKARADAFAKRINGAVVRTTNSGLFRVQLGPYATNAEGQKGLADTKRLGYSDARLTRD